MPLQPILPPQVPPTPQAGLAQRLAALADGARAGQPESRAELSRACQMLEAHFVGWLLREMRQTIPHSGLLPHGPTEETYEHLLDDALAKAIARGGGIGLARAIEAQLTRRHPAARAAQPEGGPSSTHDDPGESR
jgi:flagellar protein FlgJ